MKNVREKATTTTTTTSSSFIPVVNTITAEEESRHYCTNATTTASSVIPAIENSKAYFNFINSIRSPASRKTYEFVIRKYTQYHNVQAVDDWMLLAPIVIEDQIIRWLVSLRANVCYVTRRTYMAAMLTLYEINDVILRKRKIALFLGQETTRRNNLAGQKMTPWKLSSLLST